MNKFQTESGTSHQELEHTGGHMTKEFIEIVLAKCDERERMGYDNLTDSDIMDILAECGRKNIDVTHKDLERLGMN